MKAIVVREFGGPDVMKLEDVPVPSPGPGQLLVRVAAVGVNPVDAYIRSGTYARKPTLPYTPGTDIARHGWGRRWHCAGSRTGRSPRAEPSRCRLPAAGAAAHVRPRRGRRA